MGNARLDEAQAGFKIAGRNIRNLRYADDTTLMAESEEELKSVLIKVNKKGKKAGLKLSSGTVEKISFHSNPKEGQRQTMFNLLYNCVHFTC